jgi:hypothetical protein
LVNKRLSVVETTVNEFIEFAQAREMVLIRAHTELGTVTGMPGHRSSGS